MKGKNSNSNQTVQCARFDLMILDQPKRNRQIATDSAEAHMGLFIEVIAFHVWQILLIDS